MNVRYVVITSIEEEIESQPNIHIVFSDAKYLGILVKLHLYFDAKTDYVFFLDKKTYRKLTVKKIPGYYSGSGDLTTALLLSWLQKYPNDLTRAVEKSCVWL